MKPFLLGGAVIGAAAVLTGTLVAATRVRHVEAQTDRAAVEARIRDADIAFYQGRIARDTSGAADRAQLGALYLRRARETGDNSDLVRAETLARASLDHRRSRNARAYAVLANSLVAQHRFDEALDAERALLTVDSTDPGLRGLAAETLSELGRYDEAKHLFDGLGVYSHDPAIAPRLARWAELHGDPLEARRLLRLTQGQLTTRPAVTAEQRAWLHLRLGDLALRQGQLAEAGREYGAGLRESPDDYRLWAARARLAAARRDWPAVIDAGERAIAQSLDPATLGLLADAYAATGDSAAANERQRAMEVAVVHQAGPFHRAWSLYLLNHGLRIPDVLAKATEELRVRRDIYGWDLYAWALHHSGRDADARAAMIHALALGTRDAQLFHHASVIARALGNAAAADAYQRTADSITPCHHE